MIDSSKKDEVFKAIYSGLPLFKRFGPEWKGHKNFPITKEQAFKIINNLNWTVDNPSSPVNIELTGEKVTFVYRTTINLKEL